MTSKIDIQMTSSEISFWAIHIYQEGRFERTVSATFTQEGADLFCKIFNQGRGETEGKNGSGDNGMSPVKSMAVAVMAEVRCKVEVAARI